MPSVLLDLAASLRPPPWPALPDADRPRVRALALFAAATQALFVAAWIIAGALERGYSPVRMYVSELGRRGAAHPWIFDVSVVIWGAGFVALGIALVPGLRTRSWWWAAPCLFVLAGVLVMLEAPLRLDCASSVDHVCAARQAAGALSWRHYGHQAVSFAIVAMLVLTPFALARAERPSRLARLTARVGFAGAILWALSLSTHGAGHSAGLWQRIGLLIVHAWVLVCATALLVEALPDWPRRSSGLAARPTDAARSGPSLGHGSSRPRSS
jgi:hypothetical membrane protein